MFQIIFRDLVPRKSYRPCDIFGVIYIKIDDFYFPHKDWTDFAIPIVAWWKESFEEMEKQTLERCELWFMDGYYLIEVVNRQDRVDLNFMNYEGIKKTIYGIEKSLVWSAIKEAFLVISAI